MPAEPADFSRYQRQMLLPELGRRGQERLAAARVLLVGCGALGSVIGEQLVRAGVGTLLVADRDVVELTNLQRQSLFDESSVHQPKASAAAQRLEAINSGVRVIPHVHDVDSGNIERLAGLSPKLDPVDLILDGTDNVQTRYLINDVAVKHGVPWIYGGCVGTQGRFMVIDSPRTACLACIFPEPPPARELETCDVAGVLGSAAAVVGSWQAIAAIKLLSGNREAVAEELVSFDFWHNRVHVTDTSGAKRGNCACCGEHRYAFLDAPGDTNITLCGGGAVHFRAAAVDPDRVAERLAGVAEVRRTEGMLRCALVDPPGIVLTLFADGRVIVKGTDDARRARAIYARFVGA